VPGALALAAIHPGPRISGPNTISAWRPRQSALTERITCRSDYLELLEWKLRLCARGDLMLVVQLGEVRRQVRVPRQSIRYGPVSYERRRFDGLTHRPLENGNVAAISALVTDGKVGSARSVPAVAGIPAALEHVIPVSEGLVDLVSVRISTRRVRPTRRRVRTGADRANVLVDQASWRCVSRMASINSGRERWRRRRPAPFEEVEMPATEQTAVEKSQIPWKLAPRVI